MIAALRQLGFEIETAWDSPDPETTVFASDRPLIPAAAADLFVANSGTTMRFLTAMVGLGAGRYRLDGVPARPAASRRPARGPVSARHQRPQRNRQRLSARRHPGRRVEGRPRPHPQRRQQSIPLRPAPGRSLRTGRLCPQVDGPLVSEPYVTMTLRPAMGAAREPPSANCFHIAGRQQPDPGCPREYEIEPDASAASYFFAAAAISGGRVTVNGLPEDSLQGDVRFVDLLADMGCRVERCSAGITVHGRPSVGQVSNLSGSSGQVGNLSYGIDVDMNDISDTVMTLAAVACFADGPTTIRNVGHIRHKETDRLAALATELRRIGAGVEEWADGLTITPAPLHGAVIETYNDHRMAMSLALVGLRVPGIVIKDPGCVAKTYPGFFADLETLRC